MLPTKRVAQLCSVDISRMYFSPQSYLFQYLYGLRQPTNLALAKGSMCHEALEKVFDLDPQDRTLEHLQNLFRATWAKHRLTEKYKHLFFEASHNLEAEITWGKEGLKLLQNYHELEDPRTVTRPNPVQREIWLSKKLTVDPTCGATGANANGETEDSTFLVRGIVDRLDMVRVSKYDVALRIVDYKVSVCKAIIVGIVSVLAFLSFSFYCLIPTTDWQGSQL